MGKSKVIDLSKYRKNKNVLKGAEEKTTLSLVLDTLGPSVDVDSELSYFNGTALFDFRYNSPDVILYKTWGDYNTTPSGINYDLCGDTEANAPWVELRDTIMYSLGNTSPVAQHTFYFKFKDDVWNETLLTVEGEYEKTVDINVEELAGSKEQYLTIMIDSDSAISGYDYTLETKFFDTFVYTETVSDDPDVRPVILFRQDVANSNEFDSIVVAVEDRVENRDSTILSMPLKDAFTFDYRTKSVEMIIHDILKANADISFMLGDTADTSVSKEHGLINAVLTDEAGPYGVFFYFAVKIKASYGSDESIEFLHLSSDSVDYTESLDLLMPLVDKPIIEEKQLLTEKLLQKENPDLEDKSIFSIAENDLFISQTAVLPDVLSADSASEYSKPWVDVDYLTHDACRVLDELNISIPVDYFGVSEDMSYIDVALYEAGFQPKPPEWIFEVNAFEELTSIESLISDIGSSDYLRTAESALTHMVLTDSGILPAPTWVFEVNSDEIVTGMDNLMLSLPVIDTLSSWSDVVMSPYSSEKGVMFRKYVIDADLIGYDAGFLKASLGVGLPAEYTGIESSLVYPEVKSDDIGYLKYIVNEEQLLFERVKASIVPDISMFVSDTFNSYEYSILDLFSSQHSLVKDVLVEQRKSFHDFVSGSSSYGLNLALSANSSIFESGVLGQLSDDMATGTDKKIFIDVDLLQKDYTKAEIVDFLTVISEEQFFVREDSVITLDEWDYTKAKFVVSINKEDHPIIYINTYDLATFKDYAPVIELRGIDPSNGFEGAVIILDSLENFSYKDYVNTFDKRYYIKLFGMDVSDPLRIPVEDSVVSEITPMLNQFSGEETTGKDVLIEFHKRISDTGISIDSDNNFISMPVEVSYTLTDSSVLNTFGADVAVGKDILAVFHKNYFDDGTGLGTVQQVIPINDILYGEENLLLSMPLFDVAKGTDVLIEFHKILVSENESRDTQSLYLVGNEIGAITDDTVIRLLGTVYVNVTEKQRLTEIIPVKEILIGSPVAWLNIEGQEFAHTDATISLLQFAFEYAESEEEQVITSKLYQKEEPVYFDTLMLNILATQEFDAWSEVVINPTGTDIGYAEFVATVVEDKKEYYVYVYEFGFAKERVVLGIEADDYVIDIEQGVLDVVGIDYFDASEVYVHDILVKVSDIGYSCYNTIIYDPTITQRDLLYWWEAGYLPGDHLTEKTKNPLWGQPIKPGDIDYPYYPGDTLYRTTISYILGYDFDTVGRDFTLSILGNFYMTRGEWYYDALQSIGPKIRLIEDVLKVEFDTGLQAVVDFPLVTPGSDPEFYIYFDFLMNLYVNGATSASKTVNLAPYLDYVFKSLDYYDTETTSDTNLVNIFKWVVYEKGTLSSEIIFSNFEEIFDTPLDFETDTYEISFELRSKIRHIYTGTHTLKTNVSLTAHCNYWEGTAIYNPEYIEYREKYIYNADELFTALDPYPGFLSYKLYINLGCGVEPEYIWNPKSKMEKFVLDKAMKYTRLDLIMPFAGDLVTVTNSEDAVITFAEKDIGNVEEHFNISSMFSVFDAGYGCFNTIIYDPSITERNLKYWWEPNYAPGGKPYFKGQDLTGIHFTPNPDWGKPIISTDIDYPFFKGDERYGETIPFYVEPKNLYSAWDGYKHWAGYGHWRHQDYGRDIWIPYTTSTITSENSDLLFTTYDPIFRFSSFSIEVVEKYFVTPYTIPWDTEFALILDCKHLGDYGKYNSIGTKKFSFTLSIISQEWTDENTRVTVYEFTPKDNDINCYDLFKGYDLSRDHFDVRLYCAISWYGTWHEGSYYTITADYKYYGEWRPADQLYISSRRQVIYDDAQWFATNDVLYYDPLVYKLYINIDCGLPEYMDRIPENPMDKFVLDKMTKYARLNIIAPYPGDHATAQDDAVISLFSTEYFHAFERWNIVYTLYFKDYGYTCEDTVIYSRSEFQDRDLMYWWEKDYPIVLDEYDYIPNPLLGREIKPKDFDYPYSEGNTKYGEIIEPDKHKADPYFNPSKNRDYHFYNNSHTLVDSLFFPLKPLTDGMEIKLTGHLKSYVGKVSLTLVVARYLSEADYPTTSPVVVDPYYFIDYVSIMPVAEAEAVRGEISSIGQYPFWPVDTRFVNKSYTIRYQDIENRYVTAPSTNNFYVGVLMTINTEQTSDVVSDVPESHISCGYSYYVDFSTDVEEYGEQYLTYRAKGMHPTDNGFITRDYYNDLFGFKFYVNLGCGPDLDAFPIDNNDDFERWIFSTARYGNLNREYLFDGELGQVIEEPIIELKRLWTIHVKFHVYFNNYEFTVFEKGDFDYSAKQVIIGEDDVKFFESTPVIMLPQSDTLTSSVKTSLLAKTTLHEYGTFNVTPVIDLLGADSESSFDNAVISIPERDAGDIDYRIKFTVMFKQKEDILGTGEGIIAVPVDDTFYSVDDGVINIPSGSLYKSGEHSQLIKFIYVYDDAEFVGKPIVNDLADNSYPTQSEAEVGVAVKYTGQSTERIWHDRKEVLKDVGYVCFWVQVVIYPYVIDWLACHFVDYVNNSMEAEYFRFTSCFGIPPGGWPKVQNYPDHRIVPSGYKPLWDRKHGKEEEGYRRKEPIGKRRDRTGGYIRYPLPTGDIVYIVDPVNPPEPYVWDGGTSIFLSKSIFDLELENPLMIEDTFYFALFDELGNIVSDVQSMVFDSVQTDSGTIPGNCFGAMVFFDLDPNTTYYIRETDKYGNILGVDLESEYTGNKYLMPQDGLVVSTGEEGQCVDGGDFLNLVESFGDKHGEGGGGGGDNYRPVIYDPPSKPSPKPPHREAPFRLKPYIPHNPPKYPLYPPYVDKEYFPPTPWPYPPTPFPDEEEDVPGYEGKLVHNNETTFAYKELRITVPVDMYASIWEYHYIPATFILDLTGMKIDFYDGFDFEIEEPFRFDFDGFKFEIEEPFKFDATEFILEVEPGFKFAEDFFVIQYVQEFHLDEVYFEFDMLFEDFKFEWIDYDGQQITPAMEVVADVVTYDGYAHPLCYPKGAHGIVYYQVDGDDLWSKEIPERVEAGSYTVNWYAMASLDYSGYGSEENYHSTLCSIRRANPVIDIEDIVIPYGSEKDFDFMYEGDGEVTSTVDDATIAVSEVVTAESSLGGVQANTKRLCLHVTARKCGFTNIHILSGQGNNYFAGEKIIKCSVESAEMRFTAFPVVVLYGEEIRSNIVVYGPSQYTIVYADHSLMLDDSGAHSEIDFYNDVGEYTVYFEIKAPNYVSAYGKFKLSISLIPQNIVITTYNEVYDTKAHPLIVDVTGAHGTMWYSIDKSKWSTDIPYGALPGTYTIYWYCVGDGNYYDEGTRRFPNKIEAVIEKMDIVAKIDDLELDLAHPETVIVTIPTPSNGLLRITYSDYSVILAELKRKTVEVTPLKFGGAFVYVKQLEDFFYKEHTFIFHVAVVDTRIIYAVETVTAVYNGDFIAQSGVTVSVPAEGQYTIKYSKTPISEFSILSPTPAFYKEPGEYKIYFVISAYGYTTVYDSYDLVIEEATFEYTVTPVVVIYDGSVVTQSGVTVNYPAAGQYTIRYAKTPIGVGTRLYPTPAFYSEEGEYKIYFELKADGFATVHDYYDLTIASRDIEFVTTPVIAEYTGDYITQNGITITYPSADICTIRYARTPVGTSTPLYPTPNFYKNPGEYKVYFKITAVGYSEATGYYDLIIEDINIEVTGKVVSATTGQPVSGATIVIKQGATVLKTVTTDSDGKYSVNLPKNSMYTAVVSCSGYITETYEFSIGDSPVTIDQFVLTPEITDQIRIVLTWGRTPNDLDSYLQRFTTGGKTAFTINYSNKQAYDDGVLVAELDVDTRLGYGPETITIYNYSGEFMYYVKDFNETGNPINATVKIYVPGQPVKIVTCNQVVGHKKWYVCRIVDGNITVLNDVDN